MPTLQQNPPPGIIPFQMVKPIGKFKIGDQEINGTVLEDVVAYVTALPADSKEIWVDIATPGGLKPEGDRIYNFLKSLQNKQTVVMNQVGLIGSIGTKIVFAGQRRIALDDGTDNWFIHNPWQRTEGDAQAHLEAYMTIKPEEDELRAFYMAQTGINQEGIGPLMDVQTGFNADKAVAMKFATEKRVALKTAAYYMKNGIKTLGQELDAILAGVENLITGKKPTLAMVMLKLADGVTSIAVNADDPSKLEGAQAFTVDATGNATAIQAPAMDYTTDDGRTVTVGADGKVSKVSQPAAVAAPDPTQVAAISALVAAAQKTPAKALTLAADITALLKKPVKKVESDEDDEEVQILAAKIDKLAKLLDGKKAGDEKAELMALIETKFTELKGQIKSNKKPEIKSFKKPEDYKSPAQQYLEGALN